jgi:hypothetical protein
MTTFTQPLPIQYPEDAMSIIRDIRNKGGIIFGIRPDGPEVAGGCANCNSTGRLGVQYLEGPHQDPSGKKVTSYRGKWYTPNTALYTCPVCNGTGK